MFLIPIVGAWFDIIVLSVIFALANKLIQHLVINPKEYAQNKIQVKKINKEMQKLIKENKVEEAKKKQKESLQLMKDQMKFAYKPMFYVMIIAFPILYLVKEYYGEIVYNFGLFQVTGLWAYIIIGIFVSLFVTKFYDSLIEKKYRDVK